MALTWEFRNSLVGCMKRWSLAILLHELLRTNKQIFTRIFKFLPFLYVSILQAALSQIDGEYLLEVACPRKKLLVLQQETSMLDVAMIDWMFPSPPIGNDQVWDCDDWHLKEVMHAALPGCTHCCTRCKWEIIHEAQPTDQKIHIYLFLTPLYKECKLWFMTFNKVYDIYRIWGQKRDVFMF